MQPAAWTYRGAAHGAHGDTELVLHFEQSDGETLAMALPLADAERLQLDVAVQLYIARQPS